MQGVGGRGREKESAMSRRRLGGGRGGNGACRSFCGRKGRVHMLKHKHLNNKSIRYLARCSTGKKQGEDSIDGKREEDVYDIKGSVQRKLRWV